MRPAGVGDSWRRTGGRAGSPECHGGSAGPGVAKTGSSLTGGPEQGVTPKGEQASGGGGEPAVGWEEQEHRNSPQIWGECVHGTPVHVWPSPFAAHARL